MLTITAIIRVKAGTEQAMRDALLAVAARSLGGRREVPES